MYYSGKFHHKGFIDFHIEYTVCPKNVEREHFSGHPVILTASNIGLSKEIIKSHTHMHSSHFALFLE